MLLTWVFFLFSILSVREALSEDLSQKERRLSVTVMGEEGGLSLDMHPKFTQGEVLSLALIFEEKPLSVVGYFGGHQIPIFQRGDEFHFGALIGADLLQEPASYEFRIEGENAQGAPFREIFSLRVDSGSFGIQELTLPREMVDLDEQTLRRVREEDELVKKVLEDLAPIKRWRGGFSVPVEGKVAGTFGLRRMINGQPRSPHSGEDIQAPLGSPVHASNDGVVKLVGDFFFSGRSIILDHGLGLYTLYFHLSDVMVKEGMLVRKGEVIGSVGATGRVTGPHLHWGMRLGGARVNPFSMVNIPLDDEK